MPYPFHQALRKRLALLLLPALLAACGGDSGSDGPPSASDCSVEGQKAWLGDYMNEWYFWYRISPQPDARAYADVQSYFDALLYTGSSADFPRDRYSGSQTTESFNRFFGDGASMGYGISVAGLELNGNGALPLYVRYVEPLSPAAVQGPQGVQRGDRVLTINGRAASELIAADDFSALSAQQPGDVLTLTLRRNGADRTVTVSAAIFNLTPVTGTTVITTAGGRRLGYVAVKDMISQALTPFETAFSRFRAEGVQDVVLDLRYNGGGLVSTGGTLASYIAGTKGTQGTQGGALNYASLLYNDKRASTNNSNFRFTELSSALSLPRVFVLMGERTCSASEQVINGLRGAGLEVVAVGDTSCGKPVGFLPTPSCGRSYSVVNFESVNHRNEGRYFDGFAPTCAVAEDFTAPQGGANDPLMSEAKRFADSGRCSPALAGRAQPLAARRGADRSERRPSEPDVSLGMIPR